MTTKSIVTTDVWLKLRATTSARIALGRAGGSLPTQEWLDFKAAHAEARDAVHNEFAAEQLAAEIRKLGAEVLVLDSAAPDRLTFLQRPDLGRQLDERSRYLLQELPNQGPAPALAIVISDGLSALAVERHVPPLLAAVLPWLTSEGWRIGPVVIARYGRVALQDEVGNLLGAQLALTLIGERPGLGSPDSLGAYLVYAPRAGNTDAQRNCVSNIRPAGLSIYEAANTIYYLLTESRRKKLSGTQLKDQRVLANEAARRAISGD